MIRFDGVTKRYPDGTVAVDDLTLEVPQGSLTVFVGPSGCGKTTSMRMINRMTDPTSGTVTVDGRDVAGVDPVALRLGIGYVIQSGGLMPHQRVIDNVATVPVLKGQSRRAARRAAYEVLERVGLDPKLGDRYPAQLSGGQQQRVGVTVHRSGGALYDSVTAGGSLCRPDGTLRTALDAALSSPSGIGVAVDDSGAVIGGVVADQVIDALEDQRRSAD